VVKASVTLGAGDAFGGVDPLYAMISEAGPPAQIFIERRRITPQRPTAAPP
jgi:hypothetical protein